VLERALHRWYARLKARSSSGTPTPYPRLPREQSAISFTSTKDRTV
jgi:hypothetical protein